MNPDVKFAMDTKSKYGVTFTKNMSVQDLCDAWDRVIDPIKQASGSLGAVIEGLKALITAQEALRTTTTTLTEVYNQASKAIELASIPAGATQATPLAAAEGAKLAEKVVNKQIEDAPQTILDILAEQV